jgi:hypothetical protein
MKKNKGGIKMKIGDFKKAVLYKIWQDFAFKNRTPTVDYQTAINEILYETDDTEKTKEEIADKLTKVQDFVGDYADNLIDTYTTDQLDWYSNDANRIDYMDDAIKELGAQEAYQILSGGQYLYWEEVLNEVIEAGLEVVQTEDNETEEDKDENENKEE